MEQPFLQTPEWLEFQRHCGRRVWRMEHGCVSANIIRHDTRFGQNFLYIPYGPSIDLEQAREGLHNEISTFISFARGLARDEKSMFIKIEPAHDVVLELLMRNGVALKKSNRHLQPARTVVADLTQTEDELLDKLHHKHRYNIGLAQRHGVTIAESHDSTAFWNMLQATAEHDSFRTHGRQYYEQLVEFFSDPNGALRTKLFFAYKDAKPIAGAIIMEYGTTATYLHGASDYASRALMAPHLLHWTLMKRYKEQGFKGYDFWGIDSRRWPGVTRFKLGFGARFVEYPGPFDVVTRPWLRWLYQWMPR